MWCQTCKGCRPTWFGRGSRESIGGTFANVDIIYRLKDWNVLTDSCILIILILFLNHGIQDESKVDPLETNLAWRTEPIRLRFSLGINSVLKKGLRFLGRDVETNINLQPWWQLLPSSIQVDHVRMWMLLEHRHAGIEKGVHGWPFIAQEHDIKCSKQPKVQYS